MFGLKNHYGLLLQGKQSLITNILHIALNGLIFIIIIIFVWKEQNYRVFAHVESTESNILELIQNVVVLWVQTSCS